MLRTTAVQSMKLIASKNFELGEVVFKGFNSVEEYESEGTININRDNFDQKIEHEYNQLDIWAELSISYSGDCPDSYRVINSMIMDWVDDNEDKIKEIVNPELKKFLNEKYPDIDDSDLDTDFDDYIWEDQVDYTPEVDLENKKIDFSVELVLEICDEDGDEDDDE